MSSNSACPISSNIGLFLPQIGRVVSVSEDMQEVGVSVGNATVDVSVRKVLHSLIHTHANSLILSDTY